MAETLKPCPFCGGEAHIKKFVSACSVVYTVGCSDSECMGFETLLCKPTPEEAVAAWNRRAERTCRMEYQTGPDNPKRGWFKCSECGGLGDSVGAGWNGNKNRVNAPRFCPRCGARVVSK